MRSILVCCALFSWSKVSSQNVNYGIDETKWLEIQQSLSLLGVNTSDICHLSSSEYDPYIPFCDPSNAAVKRRLEQEDGKGNTKSSNTKVFNIVMSLVCVSFGALAAGLTLGLLSLDPVEIHVKQRVTTDDRLKKDLEKLLPVVCDHHRLLVTLLLLNSTANEALPIFLDGLVPEYIAVIMSVTVVLIFGEIIPSAIFTGPRQMSIAVFWIPFVKFMELLFAPIALPIVKILDCALGHEESTGKYNRKELAALVRVVHDERKSKKRRKYNRNSSSLSKRHLQTDARASSRRVLEFLEDTQTQRTNADIHDDEVKVVEGALQMMTKTVKDIYTPWERVNCVSCDMVLNDTSIERLYSNAHSRFPVYVGKEKKNVYGIFSINQLVIYNPSHELEQKKVASMDILTPRCVSLNTNLVDLLNLLQDGLAMALVCLKPEVGDAALSEGLPVPTHAHVVGIVTLEDVIEEIIQEEIDDEMDIYKKVDPCQEESVSTALLSHKNSTSNLF